MLLTTLALLLAVSSSSTSSSIRVSSSKTSLLFLVLCTTLTLRLFSSDYSCMPAVSSLALTRDGRSEPIDSNVSSTPNPLVDIVPQVETQFLQFLCIEKLAEPRLTNSEVETSVASFVTEQMFSTTEQTEQMFFTTEQVVYMTKQMLTLFPLFSVILIIIPCMLLCILVFVATAFRRLPFMTKSSRASASSQEPASASSQEPASVS